MIILDNISSQRYCIVIIILHVKDNTIILIVKVSLAGEFYFWTGGVLSPDKSVLTWLSGVEESVVRGAAPWSGQGLRGPQPDGQGSEDCLAILNNLYSVRFASF